MLTPGVRVGSVLFVIVCQVVNVAATPLDPTQILRNVELKSWIRNYEPVNYDSELLRFEHRRVQRSLGRHPYVRLDIKGKGRVFKLKLLADRNTFAEDAVFESTNGPLNYKPNSVYTGTLDGGGWKG